MNKIYRSTENKLFTGVIGGLSEHLKVDSTLLRIIAIIAGLFTGWKFLVLYLVCSLLIPVKPDDYYEAGNDEERPALNSNGRTIIGIIAIAFGGLILTDNLFSWIGHDFYWGACFVLVGVIVILSGRKKMNHQNNG